MLKPGQGAGFSAKLVSDLSYHVFQRIFGFAIPEFIFGREGICIRMTLSTKSSSASELPSVGAVTLKNRSIEI
jgi:hypothetical protein